MDDGAARERVQMVKVQYPAEALYERMDLLIPEITGYSTAGLAAMGYAPDKMTDAMASVIAAQQLANGSWHVGRFFSASRRRGRYLPYGSLASCAEDLWHARPSRRDERAHFQSEAVAALCPTAQCGGSQYADARPPLGRRRCS